LVKPLGAQARTPADVFLRLAKVAGEDILVGGQALAVWVEHYGIAVPEGVAAISRDVDFLTTSPTDRDSVGRYADALHGKTFFPSRRAMTSLVGQAFLLLPDDEYINVDVLWSVIGLTAPQVRARAVTAERADASFRVMHELHVLRSRLANLHELKEKQDASRTSARAAARCNPCSRKSRSSPAMMPGKRSRSAMACMWQTRSIHR
jgi:hypothetical protein